MVMIAEGIAGAGEEAEAANICIEEVLALHIN
jgi:hypothetical protein